MMSEYDDMTWHDDIDGGGGAMSKGKVNDIVSDSVRGRGLVDERKRWNVGRDSMKRRGGGLNDLRLYRRGEVG